MSGFRGKRPKRFDRRKKPSTPRQLIQMREAKARTTLKNEREMREQRESEIVDYRAEIQRKDIEHKLEIERIRSQYEDRLDAVTLKLLHCVRIFKETPENREAMIANVCEGFDVQFSKSEIAAV